jgi:hypothetical protein
MPSLNGVLVFSCLYTWNGIPYMFDVAESHACQVGEWSQCIQLFSYMDWNPLLYVIDKAESHSF